MHILRTFFETAAAWFAISTVVAVFAGSFIRTGQR